MRLELLTGRWALGLWIVALTVGTPGARQRVMGDTVPISRPQAADLVRLARRAIGEEKRLQAINALAIVGKISRTPLVGTRRTIDVRLELLLPDNYRREEVSVVGEARLTSISGFSGDVLLRDLRSDSAELKVAIGPQDGQLQRERETLARLALVFLLRPIPPAAADFGYGGCAGFTYQGNVTTGCALNVAGESGFAARVFVHSDTHRTLAMTYDVVMPRLPSLPGGGESVPTTLEVSDHRVPLGAEGILFPHQLTRKVAGRVVEEWNIEAITVNPPITVERFRR